MEIVFICGCRIIDVLGDGIVNDGIEVLFLLCCVECMGIMINGIVIESMGFVIMIYYCRQIIICDGFVIIVCGYCEYFEVICWKILCEIIFIFG